MIARLPVRWRLTAGFALAFALLVLLLGVALRVGFVRSLDDGINASLSVRADEVRALVAANGAENLSGLQTNRLSEADESFAQILDPSGRVVASSSSRLAGPLLDRKALQAVGGGGTYVTIPRVQGLDHRARLFAVSANDDARSVVVVGSSLEDRDDALGTLTLGLLIAGPIAVALASALGYLLAASALRPVEAMRRQAASISGTERGARLPLAPADDEVRALGQTLNSMLDRIGGAVDRERTFVADASHELRTPLAILQTEIDLALLGERSTEELRAALASAREETNRLSRLATDLLVLASAQDGELSLVRERLDAATLIKRVAERFSVAAAQADRSVVTDAEGDLPLWADEHRLEQAVGNLVDNALRHGRGTVRVGAARVETGVRFVVSDDGPGMSPDFAPHAFERFSRADAARTGDGAGLGLAIVRAVARAHGGEAELWPGPPPGVAMTIPDIRGVGLPIPRD